MYIYIYIYTYVYIYIYIHILPPLPWPRCGPSTNEEAGMSGLRLSQILTSKGWSKGDFAGIRLSDSQSCGFSVRGFVRVHIYIYI